MAKKFPEIKEKNEGKFTAWVEKNMSGMDTCKAASKIMRSRTKKYSPAVVKMANYANNFGCKTKKDDGASVPLKGKQKNLPDALKSKILASDGASMKKPKATSKSRSNKRKTVEVEKSVYRAPRGKHAGGRTAVIDKTKTTHNKKTGAVTTKKKRVRKGENFKSGTSGRSVTKSKLTSYPYAERLPEETPTKVRIDLPKHLRKDPTEEREKMMNARKRSGKY